MASIIWTFGSYDFIAKGTVPKSLVLSGGWRLSPFVIPQRHGEFVNAAPKPDPVAFNIRGVLNAATGEALRTIMDDLKEAFDAGRQQFKVWDDRYWNVTAEKYRVEYRRGPSLTVGDFTADLLADEGVQISTTLDTNNETTDDTPTITSNGNAATPPTITVTAPGGGLTQVILKNTTSSKTLTWNGSLSSGEELTINMDTIVITEAGVEDYSGFAEGSVFWNLEPGANALDIASTPAAAAVKFESRDRWR